MFQKKSTMLDLSVVRKKYSRVSIFKRNAINVLSLTIGKENFHKLLKHTIIDECLKYLISKCNYLEHAQTHTNIKHWPQNTIAKGQLLCPISWNFK